MVVTKDIADTIAEMHGMTKVAAEEIVQDVIAAIEDGLLNNEAVFISGFGKFEVNAKPERKGRNPITGAEITIPAKNAVNFKPAKALKALLN
jgi:DNA-binding protein HU-beta